MYAAHQGAKAVRAEFECPPVTYTRDNEQASFWGLKGAASVRDKDLTISVVNPDVGRSREAQINLGDGVAVSAKVTVLTNADIHAHNTFENPDAVRPHSQELKVSGSELRFTFAPASVTLLQVKMA
jgi:alpha-N-arabinofuranosidase